jgi:hypothetical protein
LSMYNYQPVRGKTYTLFGESDSTDQYYFVVSQLCNDLMHDHQMDETQLVNYIRVFSEKKQLLRKVAQKRKEISLLSGILFKASSRLVSFTTDIEDAVKSFPSYKIVTDRRILTTREQYYLYMIEIELVNRLYKKEFLQTNYRIAFLPHCLAEDHASCKAEPDDIDYACQGCRKTCYLNRISRLLREHEINPYIWRQASLRKLFRKLIYKYGSLGVLGVACIVELTWGMRLCMKGNIPVIGLALNANRCMRWMGDYYNNSADLSALEQLVSVNNS